MKAIDIAIVVGIVVSGSFAAATHSISVIEQASFDVFKEPRATVQEVDEKEQEVPDSSSQNAQYPENSKTALSSVLLYLYEEAVRNAGFYGYTETHIIGNQVRHYSYNPLLQIGASWTEVDTSEEGATVYGDLELYSALELMPLYLELEEQERLSEFESAEYLKDGKNFLQTPTIDSTYYRIDFVFDTLLNLEKRTEQGASIFSIEYSNNAHPELHEVLARIAEIESSES